MKKVLIAGIAIAAAAAAGGGYLLLERKLERDISDSIAQIGRTLPPGHALTHGAVKVDLFSRGGVVSDIVLTSLTGKATASELRITGAGDTTVERAELLDLHFPLFEGKLSVRRLDVVDLDLSALAEPAGPEGTPSFHRVAFAKAEAEGLMTEAHPTKVMLDRVSVERYGPGVMGDVAIGKGALGDDKPLPGNPDTLTFERAALRGYDLVAVAEILLGRRDPTDIVPPKEISVDGLVLSEGGTRFVSVAKTALTWEGDGTRQASAMVIEGIDMPVTPEMREAAPNLFGEDGPDRLSGAVRAASSYDAGKATLSVGPVEIVMDGLGAISATAALRDAPDPLAKVPDATAWMQAKVEALHLSFTDDSLLGHTKRLLAGKIGMDEAEVVELATFQIESLLSSIQPDVLAREASMKGVRTFLADPGTIELSAKPAEPMEIGELVFGAMMTSIEAVMAKLNVEITAR